MLLAHVDLAIRAQVIVFASVAVVSDRRSNHIPAVVAGMGKRWRVRAEQMVQHHHTRMLRSSQRIELVVVKLRHLQEHVPRIRELARHRRVRIIFGLPTTS